MNTPQFRAVRLSHLDKQAARLRRQHGRDESRWPPEALKRKDEISHRRLRVFSLMGKGGK